MRLNYVAASYIYKKLGQGTSLIRRLENSSTSRRLVLRINETYVDLSNSSQFRTALDKHRSSKIKHYILDMEDVQYFDSTGLGALTTFLQDIEAKKQTVILVNVGESMLEIMRVTKIDQIIPIYDDLEGAISSLESSE